MLCTSPSLPMPTARRAALRPFLLSPFIRVVQTSLCKEGAPIPSAALHRPPTHCTCALYLDTYYCTLLPPTTPTPLPQPGRLATLVACLQPPQEPNPALLPPLVLSPLPFFSQTFAATSWRAHTPCTPFPLPPASPCTLLTHPSPHPTAPPSTYVLILGLLGSPGYPAF